MIPHMKIWDGQRVREDVNSYKFSGGIVQLRDSKMCCPEKDGVSELMIGIGIDDINGNEIFTNHVVRWEDDEGEHFGLVEYDNDDYVAGFIIVFPDGNFRESFYNVEIVGTKWENPEFVFE